MATFVVDDAEDPQKACWDCCESYTANHEFKDDQDRGLFERTCTQACGSLPGSGG